MSAMGPRFSNEASILRYLRAMTAGRSWGMKPNRVLSRLREMGITADKPQNVIIARLWEFVHSGELFVEPPNREEDPKE